MNTPAGTGYTPGGHTPGGHTPGGERPRGDMPGGGAPRRTVSETHKSWWPGWIWGIPVAAIAIVVWLVLRAVSSRGIPVTIAFDNANGLKPETRVLYRGLDVGEVRSVKLEADGLHITAEVDLDKTVERFLHTGTRFYLPQPTFSDPSSLTAIIGGASILMVPGGGGRTRHFIGVSGQPPENFAVRLPYLVMFEGDVGGLKPGAPVKVRGFTVGEVVDVRLSIDATGALATPVVLVLDPTRFHIPDAAATHADWRGQLNATLAQLVRRGLRARLTQSLPLLGPSEVALEIEPQAAAAQLQTSALYPEIPAATGGGLNHLLAQAGQIPLGEIGNNVRAVTANLEALTSSRELHDSIVQLDATLSQLDRTVHAIAPRLPGTFDKVQAAVDTLRDAGRQIDATAAVARRTIGSAGSEQGANFQDALRELTDAARAARSLANELDEHPESLIRGR